uniref:Uncharacterized protein n=1 Tax=Globisporangium ultimum (strain ATCC 200006 / CBS 805.95 / DAOM BR144) TaxID=431595 RepID=K3X1Z8_GLOUD
MGTSAASPIDQQRSSPALDAAKSPAAAAVDETVMPVVARAQSMPRAAPLAASSSNVTAEMRRRGATSTHRGSLPSTFSSSSVTGSGVFGSSHGPPGNRMVPSPSIVLDRRLLQKYEEVNSELQRLTRMSRMEQNPPETQNMLQQVNAELRKARRNSSQAIQSQKELLDKLEKQEKSSFRRFFSLNKEAKMEKIKSKLADKLSESVQVDEEMARLERKSDALARTSLLNATIMDNENNSSVLNARMSRMTRSYSHSMSYSNLSTTNLPLSELQEEIAGLEREKEDILNDLFSAINNPDVHELHTRIAMYSSEIKACESIQRQVDRCATKYRQALHLLSVALATVVSPQYTGAVREFTQGPYPLAVEACHLIEAASHGIQPESRRRYRDFAPELVNVRMPKFPQVIADYARRARTSVDPHSALALEATRKLRNAENVLMLLQRLVIEKSELVDAWKTLVAQDHARAEKNHDALERRLQEQVAVLARSVSV